MSVNLGNAKKRIGVLTIIIVVALALTLIRVAYLQIFKCKEYRASVMEQQTQSSKINAMRGTIYDRNGKVLAESATVDSLIANPKQIADDKGAEIVSQRLSQIIGMDYDTVYKKVTKPNTRYQLIKKRLSVEETKAISQLKDSNENPDSYKYFKGITFEADAKRYYSYGIAPHVLGFCGYDNDGRLGVELAFDDELSGKPGSIISARSASGIMTDYEYEDAQDAQKGADVVLTIDETIQHYLENALENAVTEYSLKEGASGIVMNPKTGEILAMATKPDFNVNEYNDITQFTDLAVGLAENDAFKGYDSDDEDVQKKAVNLIMQKMWRNKAISDTYEPGSTFKIITAAAALEENVVNLNSTFYCPGYKKVADRTIKCHKHEGHGSQTFVQGVQNSCNPVFMDLGLRLGSQKFKEYFKAFGYQEKTGIELNGEASSIFYQKDKLSDTDIATCSFGQGFQITPIQHICAISSVINGGNLMKPHIVKEIRNEKGIIKSYEPEIRNKVISQETSEKMKSILEGVVGSPTGSGKNAYVKGYRIGGKTGTSEKGRNNNKRIASFVGFAPANDPEIVCLIIMDEPQCPVRYGGTICAPVVGKVIEEILEYMGVERQYTEEEAKTISKTVPEVRGLSMSAAKQALANRGFKIRISGDENAKAIVDQLPKPGASLMLDSTVILYTKEIGEDNQVQVPDVTGMSIAAAKQQLADCGLNFEAVGTGLNSTTGAYAVKQSISAGQKVQPATVISVEFRHASSD